MAIDRCDTQCETSASAKETKFLETAEVLGLVRDVSGIMHATGCADEARAWIRPKHGLLACLVRQRLVSLLAGTVAVKPKEATATLQSDMTVGGTDLWEQVKVKVSSRLN